MRIPLNWGAAIAIVYTVFAAATATFVTFAMGRPVELVSGDYYEQSLRHDERIAAERNARAVGATVSIREASQDAATIALPASQVSSARGSVTLYRPSDSRADRQQILQLDAAGTQQISLAHLTAGRWVIQVRWSALGRDYYLEQGVQVR